MVCPLPDLDDLRRPGGLPSGPQKPMMQVQRQKIRGRHDVAMANATFLAPCRSQCVDRCSGTLPATCFPAHRRCHSGQPSVVVPGRDAAFELRGTASSFRLPVGSGSDSAGVRESWWNARCSDGHFLRMGGVHGTHVEPWLTANLTATRMGFRWVRPNRPKSDS